MLLKLKIKRARADLELNQNSVFFAESKDTHVTQRANSYHLTHETLSTKNLALKTLLSIFIIRKLGVAYF